MITITKPSTRVGQWLKGVAAASMAAAIAAFAPVAEAQTGTLSNPNNCSDFTGFSWSGGILSLTCGAAPPPSGCNTTAGVFSFVSTAATVAAGNSVAAQIQRVGGCAGAYTLSVSSNAAAASGSLSTGSVTFNDGDTGVKSVLVTTTANSPVGAQISVTLGGGPTNAAAATFVATVTAGANVGPPLVAGCTTTATYNLQATTGVQFYNGTTEPDSRPPLKPGESISAAFVYRQSPSWVQVDVGGVTNPAAGAAADIEVNIDACPGNFTATQDTGCSKRIGYPAATSTPVYGTVNGKMYGVCNLVNGATYYLNVRQVVPNYAAGSQPSCTNSNGCALRVKAVNLN